MKALLGFLLIALVGCETIDKLRNAVLNDIPSNKASLRVDVVPDQGVSILLDGNRVASTSPYLGNNLQPGGHTLEVRAMGYFPVSLPVVLKGGELLVVPVTLRPRAP